tara:strand:+ start:95 stop:247 length:153 start_codon:yes stop_codon:yes gene_type:complete
MATFQSGSVAKMSSFVVILGQVIGFTAGFPAQAERGKGSIGGMIAIPMFA